MIKKIILSASAIAFLNTQLYSNTSYTESAIQSAFGASNVLTNSTGSSQWKDPGSGIDYYSGGGLTVKFKNNAGFEPWFSARGPSISAGCAGFSLDAGFASIINLDGLTDQLSDAGTSIVGGFMSSILYSTPILGDVLTEVKKISDYITKLLQNACNIGKALGTTTGDYISEKYKSLDVDDAVKTVKDVGEETYSKIKIEADKTKLKQGMDCFTQIDVKSCLDGISTTSPLKTIPASYSNAIIKLKPAENVASSLVSKNIAKSGKENSFFIDSISLSDYMSMDTSKKSKHDFIKRSNILTNYGKDIGNILLLATKQPMASNSLCGKLETLMKTQDSNATSSEKQKGVDAIIDSITKENINAGDLSSNHHKNLGVKVGANGAFDFKKDIVEYVMTGKVNNQSVNIENASVVVSQLVSSAPKSDINSNVTKKYTFLCTDSSNGTYTPSWGGISTLSAMQTQIDLIANDAGASSFDTSVPIVAEAAQLAKTLGKKYAIQQSGEKVLALTITSRNLALLNRYIIISRVLEAIDESLSLLDTNIGSSQNEETAAQTYSKETLMESKNILRNKLSQSMGTEDFMTAILRDAKAINDKYDLLKLRRVRK